MTNDIDNEAIEAVLRGDTEEDRRMRIARLEKDLAKVRRDIEEQARLEARLSLVNTAFTKLKKELGKTLTEEEYRAIDGAYIFLHSGCVDLIRAIPDGTSRGEDKKLLYDLDTAESLRELKELRGKS